MAHPITFPLSRKVQQWHYNHICTQPERLPDNFFNKSPFGKSLITLEERANTRVESNLNTDNFDELGFPSEFVKSLRNGLPLLLHSMPVRRRTQHHQSVLDEENRSSVEKALTQWEKDRVFEYTEMEPFLLNPLKLVITETKKRLVFDARSSGLNEHILAPKFTLPRIEAAVAMLTDAGLMIKADLANGFLQLPIRKQEQTFLGFIHPLSNRYCIIKRLPFGLTSAPFLFQTFTQTLEKGIEKIINVKSKVYIDDWFITDENRKELVNKFASFQNLLSYLGVGLQHAKTEGPATRLTYLGIGIDSIKHNLFLPETKRKKYSEYLGAFLEEKESTMETIAKMAGRLVHISAVHKEGMGHVQPLWNIMYADRTTWTRRQLMHEVLTVEESLKDSLQWWKAVLQQPQVSRKIWMSKRKKLFIWSRETAIEEQYEAITLCTDASDTGWGASTGIMVVSGMWSDVQAQTSINWRELKTVILALREWSYVRDTPVLVLTDNMTTVAAIRARSAKVQPLQDLIEEVNRIEESRKIEIVALHIPGMLNDLPDRLSRGMDINVASMLTFEPLRIPLEIRNAQQLIGLNWPLKKFDAQPFYRHQTLQLRNHATLLAVTTPDIPFLKLHLTALMKLTEAIWILIPRMPSSDLPLPNTKEIGVLAEDSCIQAPQMQWWLLEIIKQDKENAKDAT